MTGVVVDASAIAALIFDEPEAPRIRRSLQGKNLYATTLIDYELANTAWKKLRRDPSRADAFLAALHLVDRLPIDRTAPDIMQVVALAMTSDLTAYDASYLWLARRLGLRLVTLDKALARAAEALHG